jgi:hypothetical protein
MTDQLIKPITDFVRVCDELLIETPDSLTTHELDILEGYLKELTGRFFS